MSPGYVLQREIITLLKADTVVASIIGDRIFDRAPSETEYPHVTFGPSDEFSTDAECLNISAYEWQLDTWSQKQGNRVETRNLTRAIKDALHNADMNLDPYALSFIEVQRVRILDDPDPTLTHGVVVISAEIEE